MTRAKKLKVQPPPKETQLLVESFSLQPKSILAFDLGTRTGWAYHNHISSYEGYGEFDVGGIYKPGARLNHYYNLLEQTVATAMPQLIVYEHVMRWASSQAAFWYNAYLTQLIMVAHAANLHLAPVSVTKIKKFATGKGNALKVDMIAAAQKLYPDHPPILSDNIADAIHLLAYAKKHTNDLCFT